MKGNNYYVYCHYRKDNSELFYIGKGKVRRHLIKSGRNQRWLNIVQEANGFTSKILANNLTEISALELERLIIHLTKMQGKNLVNHNFGGEGLKGKL